MPKEASKSTELAVNGSCRCLTSGLSLLEALSIEDAGVNLPSAARTLHLNKRALTQCKRLLDCEFCSGASNFMMLLIVLCQNIIGSYERVIFLLTEQFNKLHSKQNSERGSMQAEREYRDGAGERNHELGQRDRMTLGDYELDPEEEPCLFGELVLLQLRTLKTLLATIRVVLKSWNWDTHILMMDSVSERVRMQLAKFGGKSHT